MHETRQGVDIDLKEFYRRIQLAPAITTFLPEQIGKGEITRICTNNGYQASSWDLVYGRETEVNGMVRGGFRLLFCMGEGIEWMSDRKRMQLAAGEACFCMDAGVSETMCYEVGCRYLFYSFAYDFSAVEHTIAAYVQDPKVVLRKLNAIHFKVTPEIRRKLQEISLVQKETSMFGMLRVEACLQELLWLCVDAAANGRVISRMHQDDAFILQRIKSGIDADPGKAEKLDCIAKEYGISVSKLSRCFKETYGMPLHAYVIESRLCEGARLLAEGKLMIGEISERVGYAKQSQFAAAFRKRFGVPPKEY